MLLIHIHAAPCVLVVTSHYSLFSRRAITIATSHPPHAPIGIARGLTPLLLSDEIPVKR
jgi:hypothetical protein